MDRTDTLVFTDAVTADKRSNMNSEAYRSILFAHIHPDVHQKINMIHYTYMKGVSVHRL